MRRRACIGLLISLGLHVALLGWWRMSEHAGSTATTAGSPSLSGMEVRLAQHMPPVRDTAGPGAVGHLASQDSLVEPVHAEQAAAAVDIAEAPAALPAIGEPPYLPSKELDAPPAPVAPVVVPFPDAVLDRPRAALILIVYIGESGRVDRVEVAQSDLPPAFEQAATDAFLQARMQPGIKDGKPSRARMKIEVEFEVR